MGLGQFAVQTLLGLSSFLGVTTTPVAFDGWSIQTDWHQADDRMQFSALSTEIPQKCAQMPDAFVHFPMVVHGAHTLALDGHIILQKGDPTFQSSETFYGSPSLKCSQLAGGHVLSWHIDSYTKYFARVSYAPYVSNSRPIHNLFAESIHLMGAGCSIIMAFFAVTMFTGKVRTSLLIALTLSCLGEATYLAGATAGNLNFSWRLLALHKLSDIGLWIGVTMSIYAFAIENLLPKRFFYLFATTVLIGCLIVLFGENGDVIQLGTCVPFPATFAILICLLVSVSKTLKSELNRQKILQILSLISYILMGANDMLVVVGISAFPPMLPVTFISGVFFLCLAVNERINETYRERDFLRTNLEDEVTRKTQELTKKSSELESAMGTLRSTQAELVQSAKLASLGTLSAGIAHEINNSLNYVNGALRPLEKIVTKSYCPEDQPKIEKLLGVMKEGLSLTIDIIKSLRNYTGLNQAKFNDVSLREAAQTSTNILKSKTRGKIEVELNIPPTLAVFGSVVGINQIFMNLISNAIDAMSSGGKLTIDGSLRNGEWVEVRVKDTGTGMSSEVSSRIFEPFFTTKDVGSGTGIGLHIVRGEMERHQGTVQVESALGQGSCFILRFPMQPANIERSAA